MEFYLMGNVFRWIRCVCMEIIRVLWKMPDWFVNYYRGGVEKTLKPYIVYYVTLPLYVIRPIAITEATD